MPNRVFLFTCEQLRKTFTSQTKKWGGRRCNRTISAKQKEAISRTIPCNDAFREWRTLRNGGPSEWRTPTMPGPINTWMGDRLWPGKPSWYNQTPRSAFHPSGVG